MSQWDQQPPILFIPVLPSLTANPLTQKQAPLAQHGGSGLASLRSGRLRQEDGTFEPSLGNTVP